MVGDARQIVARQVELGEVWACAAQTRRKRRQPVVPCAEIGVHQLSNHIGWPTIEKSNLRQGKVPNQLATSC
jgi:hypothetical protein